MNVAPVLIVRVLFQLPMYTTKTFFYETLQGPAEYVNRKISGLMT